MTRPAATVVHVHAPSPAACRRGQHLLHGDAPLPRTWSSDRLQQSLGWIAADSESSEAMLALVPRRRTVKRYPNPTQGGKAFLRIGRSGSVGAQGGETLRFRSSREGPTRPVTNR